MGFVRFSGEWFIYCVLFALGGGVLAFLTAALFKATGTGVDRFLEQWLLPCGAAGAVVVAGWQVAALGINLLLLTHLGGSAWRYARFLNESGSFAALERWQTAYLPVYGVWAALVTISFPPLFHYR